MLRQTILVAASIFGRGMWIAQARRPTTGALMSSLASLLSKQSYRRTPCGILSAGRVRPVVAFVRSATTTTTDEARNCTYDFDYLVIGGGSGGIASARRAATYGAKVAIVEGSGRLGGTCVNVGCVPKKVMWNAATIAEIVREMNHYGFSSGKDAISFDWSFLKQTRDKYIQRLNGIYERNLDNSGVTKLFGLASLEDLNTVCVLPSDGGGSVTYTAKHILIAVGGKPTFPPGNGIREHSISSDGFFELEELPRKAVVVGAGYIAVE